MKYCSNCGSLVSKTIPAGDNRERWVCGDCDYVHYQNPRIVVGCVPARGDEVLLCRRAIEPRLGYWTVPAGFMELGETMEEGAARETREEALAEVEIEPPVRHRRRSAGGPGTRVLHRAAAGRLRRR